MSSVQSEKHPLANSRRKTGIILLLLILVCLMTGACGCVRLMQQSGNSGNGISTQPDVTAASSAGQGRFPPHAPITTHTQQESGTTAGSGLQVYSASPDVTPDPYPVQHGTRVNSTVLTSRYVTPSFTKTYSLGGAPVGLGVNVTKGPFLIYFTINPKYDCLNDPDSCRGTVLVPVNRPYCTITVTDNQTGQIVAQDGYAGEFSSNTTDRSITIYGTGQYLITLEGNYLDITLSLATGDPTPVPTAMPVGQATTPVVVRRPPGPWGLGV
jgi:hypothetical protein